MNWSEFAGPVPDEVDGENAKEGCMAELLFPVCHKLWPVAVWDAREKHAVNLMGLVMAWELKDVQRIICGAHPQSCRPVAEHGEEDGGYHLDTTNPDLSKVLGPVLELEELLRLGGLRSGKRSTCLLLSANEIPEKWSLSGQAERIPLSSLPWHTSWSCM